MRLPEQKTVSKLKLIIFKFTKSCELVLYLCAGPFSTARGAFFSLITAFLGYHDDRVVIEGAKTSVGFTYETRLLNDGSDSTKRNDVLSSTRVYKEAMQRFN